MHNVISDELRVRRAHEPGRSDRVTTGRHDRFLFPPSSPCPSVAAFECNCDRSRNATHSTYSTWLRATQMHTVCTSLVRAPVPGVWNAVAGIKLTLCIVCRLTRADPPPPTHPTGIYHVARKCYGWKRCSVRRARVALLSLLSGAAAAAHRASITAPNSHHHHHPLSQWRSSTRHSTTHQTKKQRTPNNLHIHKYI